MSEARLLDGKALASALHARVHDAVQVVKSQHHLTPGLAVVLVGEHPASQVYVRTKSARCREAGMASFVHRLPADVREQDLLTLIRGLNRNDDVHGILVQLPLPDHIAEHRVLDAIDPDKDVDGFHVLNAGRLLTGVPGALTPCTPVGCLLLIQSAVTELAGLRAVVVGRSNIVGKPMALLLLQQDCTVTIAHSRTRDLADQCRQADILVAAVGRPQMIGGDWIKPGAIVVDVGINRIDGSDGKTRLVGDVDFAAARTVAGAITPVPGGVGPMTVASLLRNTLIAACRQRRLEAPGL
ncbi:MAG: bifunctional methylenetetrahydrofolate dehydrogenase/methenyltetrahydrofolate cyclohydrolase FolD [Rhodospirillales bacterium]|nr:MAG: bifunctional methylenetetrahydrofolate dehydrogenase/methenyltetrahydrofolate cyclohydrolase FolD [Rhodospirillales bacterium]